MNFPSFFYGKRSAAACFVTAVTRKNKNPAPHCREVGSEGWVNVPEAFDANRQSQFDRVVTDCRLDLFT